MYKKVNFLLSPVLGRTNNIFLIGMRVSILLLCTGLTSVYAYTSNAQTIDIDLEDVPVKTFFKEIQQKSDYVIIYRDEIVADTKKITVRASSATLETVLSEVLGPLGLGYEIINRQIIITKDGPSLHDSGANTIKALFQRTVNGTVTDSKGVPLPGANIVEKGTTNGVTADFDGNFSLNIADENATLLVSYIGFAAKELAVNNQTTINVVLEESAAGLDEVVVVGYSTQKAGELTGSISTLDSEKIEDIVAVNTTDALKGTISGVTITDSKTPGEGGNIRIRGLGTINDNEPLFIVDGVPGAQVNPQNIESISILKDASAQAIYGARAANGVILVTTKSGRKNQALQVNVDIKSGISTNTNSYNLLNTQEYGELLWLEARNENGGVLPDGFNHEQFGSGPDPMIPNFISPAGAENADLDTYDPVNNIIMRANKQGTDWLDEADREAVYQEYSLSISGGSENTAYAFQTGYLEEEGILKYTSYERYNLRANVTTNPTDWLEIGERIGVTFSKDNGLQTDNGEGSVIGWTYRTQPIIPVYDVAGNYAGSRAPRLGNGTNVMWLLDNNQYDWTKTMRLNGNVYAKATILESLAFKTLFGANYSSSQMRDLTYIENAASQRAEINGYAEGDNLSLQWNWSNTLEYTNTFADIHNFTFLVGAEAIENSFRTNSASRQGYFLSSPDFYQLDSGTENQTNSGNSSEWALFSVFGRLNYKFDNKYLLESVIRRDASSRFGVNNNDAIFPAFSLGWVVSQENFMSFSENWLNLMKIRAGYGESGNDRIGNYNSYTSYISLIGGAPWSTGADGTASYYPIDGGNETPGAVGFKRNSIGNPSVVWETTATTNFGIDLTMFRNFDFTLDLWKRNTRDMLFPQQIPAVVGRAAPPSINVGEMDNRGIDIELNYSGSAIDDALTYSVGLNFSRYKNKIVALSGKDDEFLQGGTIRGQSFTRAEKGSTFPAFYGYDIEGIFQSDLEANAHPVVEEDPTYNQEGVFKIRDTNGDGVINPDDRTIIGSPHPDYTAGLVINIGYKGFNLYTNLYASVGNEVANGVRTMIDFNKFQGNRSTRRLYESYGSPFLSENANATMPIARLNDERDQRPSSYYIEDGSYLRMQNLRLSYDLSRLFKDQTFFSHFTLYAHASNLFTITEYSGLDPEIGTFGMNTGVDTGGWPTARRYLLGMRFGF